MPHPLHYTPLTGRAIKPQCQGQNATSHDEDKVTYLNFFLKLLQNAQIRNADY